MTGFRYCNATWLITSQNGPVFAGNFQGTPGTMGTPGTLSDCARSGVLDGQLLLLRNVIINETGTADMKNCVHVESLDTTIRGVASEPGKFKGVANLRLRCPFGRSTIDYEFWHTVDMTRR